LRNSFLSVVSCPSWLLLVDDHEVVSILVGHGCDVTVTIGRWSKQLGVQTPGTDVRLLLS
jgi:hypothetical protein